MKSMDPAVDCHQLLQNFPRQEQYGLISHIQRAATSIHANMAESLDRRQTKVFLRFLFVSRGSLTKLGTYFILADHFTRTSHEDSEFWDHVAKAFG